MSGYTVTRLDEIDEVNDGRCPFRPVRHHFGIMSFGVNTWTAKAAGDRIINEHDEVEENEELYLVQQGRATFELDGERVDAPGGTFVFASPGVKRTAFAEEPETTIVAIGGRRARLTSPPALRSGRRSARSTRPANTPRRPISAASWQRRIPSMPACSTTSPAARASPGGQPMRSSTCGTRSSARSGSARSPPGTRTSMRSKMSRRSGSSWGDAARLDLGQVSWEDAHMRSIAVLSVEMNGSLTGL